MTEHADFAHLLDRLGRAHLEKRLTRQVAHVADVLGPGLTHLHIENLHWMYWMIRKGLQCTGLYKRGQRNALSPRLLHHPLRIPNLPAAFRGFRILHLSDLHSDLNTDIVTAVSERLSGLEYDICVLTGDYRARTFGPVDTALDELVRLRAALHGPVYAVLGNHDFIEMVDPMETAGIRVLLNESILLKRENDLLCLAGVDDPHYYATDDFEKLAAAMRPKIPSILLSHTPEIYSKAESYGFKLMLCGHTHGGQICLPNGRPIVCNVKCPRSMCSGDWQYGSLHGYTSRGTGVSGVDVRFYCPGEIVIHRLEPA